MAKGRDVQEKGRSSWLFTNMRYGVGDNGRPEKKQEEIDDSIGRSGAGRGAQISQVGFMAVQWSKQGPHKN